MSLQTGIERRRTAVVLVGLFLVGLLLLFKPWIHGFDTVAYYAWLRSAVIDGDLDVGDEFAHYGYGGERGKTVTGLTYNEYAVGSGVLWSPFFLAAHGLSHVARALGAEVTMDGYGPHYVWSISLGSALYGLAAILLSYRLCRAFFSPCISLLAAAAVWLSSTLVFYMYSHPGMSHANDAFAYALFLFTWQKTRGQSTWRGAALRGACAGLCALVRQINALFVLFPLGELLVEGIQSWRRTGRAREGGSRLLKMAAFSLAWWLVYLPQVLVWRVVLGRWVVVNPYAAGAGVGFDWLRPHLLEVLFSTNRGLFLWTPLMLAAALGWQLLWKKGARLTALLLVNFMLQLYLVASWECWSGSAAFGQRFFTNMVPALSLGFAALLARLGQRARPAWLATGSALFVVWNGLLIARYALGDIPHTGTVPLVDLAGGQFTVLQRHFGRIVEILLRRS